MVQKFFLAHKNCQFSLCNVNNARRVNKNSIRQIFFFSVQIAMNIHIFTRMRINKLFFTLYGIKFNAFGSPTLTVNIFGALILFIKNKAIFYHHSTKWCNYVRYVIEGMIFLQLFRLPTLPSHLYQRGRYLRQLPRPWLQELISTLVIIGECIIKFSLTTD